MPHFQTTNSRKFLDVACRFADYIGTIFGTEPGKKRGYCGHPEIELALVRLYQTTGKERYLNLSRYFVDQRGQKPYYFEQEAVARGEKPEKWWPTGFKPQPALAGDVRFASSRPPGSCRVLSGPGSFFWITRKIILGVLKTSPYQSLNKGSN